MIMIKKSIFWSLLLFLAIGTSRAQVGIGTASPNASAQLDVSSTTKGFLLPRMTTTQRNAIQNPVNGLMIYNTTSNSLNVYISGTWTQVTNTVPNGTVTSLSAGTSSGNLIWDVAASNVSSVVNYVGGNGESHSGQTVASTGVTGLTATLNAGQFAVGNGALTYTISGTPATSGTASFAINIGGQTLTLTITVSEGSIAGLTTGTTTNGTLTQGVAASNVSSVVSYTGGDGGKHNGQTVTSTGVTGLTATLSAGSFATGSGTLTYTITGTPSTSGTASFALNIGGKSATLTRTVSAPPSQCTSSTVTFTYRGSSVTYGTVTGASGKCWLDRNLGATQKATGLSDYLAYGDLFQWGRSDDGHQVVSWTSAFNSTIPNGTTSTLSSSDNPGSQFITVGSAPWDWRSPANDNLWQGASGTNNPCPSGWRLPTKTEWENEAASWSALTPTGAINSTLKLSAPGYRKTGDGFTNGSGSSANYASSTVNGTGIFILNWNSSTVTPNYNGRRSEGYSVRCIKD